jgi:hypothetical protein
MYCLFFPTHFRKEEIDKLVMKLITENDEAEEDTSPVVTSKITNGKAKQAKQTAATTKRPAQQSDSKPESEDENDDLDEEEEDDDSDVGEIEVKLSFSLLNFSCGESC